MWRHKCNFIVNNEVNDEFIISVRWLSIKNEDVLFIFGATSKTYNNFVLSEKGRRACPSNIQ